MAGGTCCYNPEPLADFVDLFLIGEGETLNSELIALYRAAKKEDLGKKEFLQKASKIPGVYVPSLYGVSYHEDGTVATITPHDGAPETVTKRIVQNLDDAYFQTRPSSPPPRSSTTGWRWRFSGAVSAAAGSARRATSTGPSGPGRGIS
jgi:radical SAM superfamily enzyme YgiQ (UPF0313 family)